MPAESPDIALNMPKGLRRFARWRSAHTGRLPIPKRLWTPAVELAGERGVLRAGLGKAEITRRLETGRASVRRILAAKEQ